MRSVIKLTGLALLLILVPSFVSGYITINNGGESSLIIGQVFIFLIIMAILFLSFRLTRSYEDKTLKMIEEADSVDQLKQLGKKRFSYKSKAEISKAILLREFDLEEVYNLRKYTNKVSDMDHYYSSLISNSSGSEREEIKIRRDNFKKKYQHKSKVYADFKGNLMTSLKWLAVFFITAIFSSFLRDYLIARRAQIVVLFFLFQMIILAIFMINTIIWLSRTVKSFWDKEYI